MKNRNEVASQDRWNVEALFPNTQMWENEFVKVVTPENLTADPKWPELAAFRGKLNEGADKVKAALDLMMSIGRHIEKLYTYAHLKHDEDIVATEYKSAFQRITSIVYDFQKECAFFEPELLILPQDLLDSYLSSPLLATYKFYLEKIIRLKPHTLDTAQEELLAMAAKALEASPKAFSAYNNADIKFGSIKDGQGNDKELSHGLYNMYIRENDRTLRENAFKQLHGKFSDMENTLTELITGLVQSHVFGAKAKKYKSSLEAALFPKNIDTSVYRSLISSVRENLPSLHRYVALRKKILKVPELHLYDMYVPLVPKVDINIDYAEAERLVLESVAPLGLEYKTLLTEGLMKQRWVDRFENRNKRSGAYSSGCYDSFPYILMNYRGILKDAFTLAHEAGHSMHSLLSNTTQPYHYASYPIFVAEVASTFNEELLMDLLLKQVKTPEEKLFLINEKIEDIRGTLFRQTMFAEYELKIHEMVESGIPLTPASLKSEYKKLNQDYFGPSAFIDDEISIEWARIPHFYYNFYVYQYATGVSAALSLCEKMLNGSPEEKNKARQAYLNFLKSGSSQYPIDLLKIAGVDMNSQEPVRLAIRRFDHLVTELEQLSS